MNLYSLHSDPEELYGFDIIPYKMPKLAFELAKSNPGLRPKLEPAIMKDPYSAYCYAYLVLNRPWPEAEPYIMKDPKYAYWYVKHVLGRPWPEAEPYIKTDPYYAYSYALYILRRRWQEAEPYIMKGSELWWDFYKRHFKLYEPLQPTFQPRAASWL